MNKSDQIYKLANNLQALFLSYGIKENKLLKLQLNIFLANEFSFKNVEALEEAINNMINNYNVFENETKQWNYFKQQAFNLINKKLW